VTRLALWRRCLRKGLLFHRESGFEIDLCGFHRFMPEPQGDHLSVSTEVDGNLGRFLQIA
jgi:hypothetical protein